MGVSDWLISLEGTEAGHLLALCLAIFAAFLHAVFGALQKGRFDPWMSRGAIDASYFFLSVPLALLVVPWPEPHMWPLFALCGGVHLVYKIFQAMAYSRGAYTVVYPVVRGTGPLFTVIGAWLLFAERFTPVQWLGVGVLLMGIYGLAVYNLRTVRVARETLPAALGLAVMTGLFVALYTTIDAYGIRATANPFTFIVWLFLIDGICIPFYALYRWRRMEVRSDTRGLLARGVIGAVVAYMSFGSIMLATRLDKVGEAAVLRETSPVFAAIIGVLVLRETVGPRRIALMTLIAAGAVIVEFGG